jgi:hypothetical protein
VAKARTASARGVDGNRGVRRASIPPITAANGNAEVSTAKPLIPGCQRRALCGPSGNTTIKASPCKPSSAAKARSREATLAVGLDGWMESGTLLVEHKTCRAVVLVFIETRRDVHRARAGGDHSHLGQPRRYRRLTVFEKIAVCGAGVRQAGLRLGDGFLY